MSTSFAQGPNGPVAYEAMDAPAWKQTLKDAPVAIIATALGYGIGKTVADLAAERFARGTLPAGAIKALPTIAAGASFVASMAAARTQGVLKDRRNAARVQEALKDEAKLEKLLAEMKERRGAKVAHLDEEEYARWGDVLRRLENPYLRGAR